MKRYLSVFEMIARSSFYKVLMVLLAMAVAQFGMFYLQLQDLEGTVSNLEALIDQSHYTIILGVAYLLITVLLVLHGCNLGSVQGYTLQRLKISEKKVRYLQSFYNVMCYGLLWVTELLILLVSSGYYMETQTHEYLSNQTVFLAFYRNELMHSILPLEDVTGWWILATIMIGTGICAAGFTWNQRRGKIGWGLIFVIAIVLLAFPRPLGGSYDTILMLLIVVIMQVFFNIALKMAGAKEESKE